MKYLLALALLLTLGCGKPPALPTDDMVFAQQTYLYNDPTVAQVPKRIVMIHGLRGVHETFFLDPWVQIYNAVIAAGWQVVMFDLPYAQRNFWDDSGVEYTHRFMAKLNSALDAADAQFGPVTQTVVLGASFGGVHALVASSLSNRVTGYVGLIPVVKINWLTEFQGETTSGMDGNIDPAALAKLPGYLMWGELDQRANFQFTVDLANEIQADGGNVTTEPHPELGHEPPQDMSVMKNWILTTF